MCIQDLTSEGIMSVVFRKTSFLMRFYQMRKIVLQYFRAVLFSLLVPFRSCHLTLWTVVCEIFMPYLRVTGRQLMHQGAGSIFLQQHSLFCKHMACVQC